MPELSRFYGIVIQMYCGDHQPPRFHALYAGRKAVIDIETLAFIEGREGTRGRSRMGMRREQRSGRYQPLLHPDSRTCPQPD
ncbi:MAG: DUF4160 domain-containing protein [Akkermansiaceae bacterium]|nr:DUF4160 domain-containing protein [Akkermansiaceae bacterium]